MCCTHHHRTSFIPHTSIAVNLAPSHSLIIHTCDTNNITHITVTATTVSTQGTPRQPHILTKDDHITIDPTQGHRYSSESMINFIILQDNINGIENKLGELKLLIHDTYAYIITFQETKLIPKANTTKYITSPPYVPIGCTRHEVGSLHSLNIAFTTTDIPTTINTHKNF